jgi:lactoylglutathione lyase
MSESESVPVTGLAHVGIRVHDLERALRFYALLGFVKVAGPIGPEPVAILQHPCGLELNLILNAADASIENALMDAPRKLPGITHISLVCTDIGVAQEVLERAGYPITEGPIRFATGTRAIFVRDPDRNVVELDQFLDA